MKERIQYKDLQVVIQQMVVLDLDSQLLEQILVVEDNLLMVEEQMVKEAT